MLLAEELSQDLQTVQESIRAAEAALKTKGELVPKWWIENQVPLRWDAINVAWKLGMKIRFSIKQIVYENYLHETFNPKSATVWFWLPVGKLGNYNVTQLHLMREDLHLPHVTPRGACLAIGDGPPAITCWRDLMSLQNSLARGLSQINLSSLLSTKKGLWPKEVRNTVPMPVRKCIRGRYMRGMSREVLETYFKRVESEQVGETWSSKPLAVDLLRRS